MITRSEIAEIIFDRCRVFNTETFIKDNIPFEPIASQRIVIIPSRVVPTKYWHECNVKVNWCVPDEQGEESIYIRSVEKILERVLQYGIGEFEGAWYRFRKDSVDTEGNTDGRYHFVSYNLLFQIQNIKKKCHR